MFSIAAMSASVHTDSVKFGGDTRKILDDIRTGWENAHPNYDEPGHAKPLSEASYKTQCSKKYHEYQLLTKTAIRIGS